MHTEHSPSQRQIRFGEVIKEIISEAIIRNQILDNEIELAPITISFVKVSRDLKIASIYIMPLGGHKKEEALNLINENKHVFQKILSKEKLKIKNIPKIRFYLDDTFDEAQKIQELLSNKGVVRDLNQ